MAGKNPAKLAETGKGCSPCRVRTLRSKIKKLFRFNSLPPRAAWHAIGIAVGVRPLGEQEMNRTLRATLTALAVLGCAVSTAAAMSRIKDLASIEGVRQNQLLGYGLVVGLNGTGDTLNNTPFTKQSLQAMLERLGVNTRRQQIRTGNVAAVMVTANLPPFATQGPRIDVTASAMGDAKSLQGGTLLVTPLLGADGNVYAVAQGSLAIGGFEAQGEAAKIVRGVPTVGRISNGAIIEREIDFALNRLTQVRLALRNADFTTAKRVASAINDYIGSATAEPL